MTTEDNATAGQGCVIIFAIILAIASICRGAAVDPNGAIGAAETLGFSNVTVKSSQWFFAGFAGCDGGDALAVRIHATNASGNPADVVACSGYPFKGWTIRVP